MAAIKENKNHEGKIVSYRVRSCMGRDAQGKQVWRTTTIPMSQIEDEASKQGVDRLTPAKQKKLVEGLANAWEAQEKEKYSKAPTARDKSRMTVGAFIDGPWMNNYVLDGGKSPNSVNYFRATSRPIKDFMGDKQIRKVDTELCSRFVAYLNTTAQTNSGKPFSQTSRMHVFGTLRNILRTARRWKYITADPTEDMTRNEKPRREKKSVEFLTEAEAREFIQALQNEPIKKRVYFSLLLVTGMRRGEAVALQWADIDEKGPTITVSKNAIVDKAQERGRLIKKTKTGETRVVPITDDTLRMLQELKRHEEQSLDIPEGSIPEDAYIFCADNHPEICIFPSTPTRWMEGIIKRYGLKKCTVHELRRTFATLALQAKIDPKTVASITGHADTATLFKYYTGTDAEQQRKVVDGISAILIE